MQVEQQQRHIQSFILEATEHLTTLHRVIPTLVLNGSQSESLEESYRAAHSIKGVAAMLGLQSLQTAAHYLEEALNRFMAGTLASSPALLALMNETLAALQTGVTNLQESPTTGYEQSTMAMDQLQSLFQGFELHLQTAPKPSDTDLSSDVFSHNQAMQDASAMDATTGNNIMKELADLFESSPWDLPEEPAVAALPIEAAASQEQEPSPDALGDLDDLDNLDNLDELLTDTPYVAAAATPEVDFSELDGLLGDLDDFEPVAAPAPVTPVAQDFSELEGLLEEATVPPVPAAPPKPVVAQDFSELEGLLGEVERKTGVPASGGSPARRRTEANTGRTATQRPRGMEQTMRVPIKQLDNLNNLVGELVVNRNSLEQDQDRLRQFLDNLLYQVQHINDAGQRMRDVYERSALEMSLVNSRRVAGFSPVSAGVPSVTLAESGSASGLGLDALELDRFSDFHLLAQDILEFIVRIREASSDIEFVVDEMEQISRMFRQSTSQIQESLTRSRMIPFSQISDRLPRAVRDIALKSGKQAELVVEGGETLIDKMILEQLYDPMTHLVNNAIAHGIEAPEIRQASGKSITGQITLRVYHQGNQTVISVSDDGAGIDPIRVKAKAIQKGLITPEIAERMSEVETYDLLFHAGFSTRDQADDFAGRGVGMDVVRTSLNEIRGDIITDSQLGKGTTFTIRLPLTLSISKALCCVSNQSRIAFPMDGVEDVLDIPEAQIQINREGQPCVQWRDSLLPFRVLSELLRFNRQIGRSKIYSNQEEDIVSIIVLRSGSNILALQVDQVLGEQEIVIKQLEGPAPKPFGITGATIQGDGQVMAIADILELIELGMGRIRRDVRFLWEQNLETPLPIEKNEPTVLIVDDSITVRELLSMTFNKLNYRVEQARDGQEAWDKLRAGLPCDLIFCDIEMPRMDGLELLSRLRKDDSLSHLPIAMLTSRGAERHRELAAQLGATAYFTKPYLEEALMEAAQKMLRGEVLLHSKQVVAMP